MAPVAPATRGRSLLALGIALCGVVSCADQGLAPHPRARTLVALNADGQALPATGWCPSPAGEDTEVWVAVGEGTLALEPTGRGTGRFTLRLDAGRGVRTVAIGANGQPYYPMQYGSGGTFTVYGTYVPATDGMQVLQFDGAPGPDMPERLEGQLLGEVAVLRVGISCPYAPAGTPLYEFLVRFGAGDAVAPR